MTDYAVELTNGAIMAAPTNIAYNFGTGDFTLETWFKTKTPGTIVSRKSTNGGAGNGGFLLVLKDGGSFKLATDNGYGFYEIDSLPTVALDGEWHHAAGVRAQGQLSLYLDGAQLNTRVFNNTDTPCNLNNSQRLVLGGTDQQQEPFNRFTGVLDDIRVWNVARSKVDIDANMDCMMSGYESGLVGYWTFNGANGVDGSTIHNDAVADGQVDYVTLGAPTNRIATITNGLVAYYPLFADGNDYSGHGHDGTPSSTVVFGTGLFGGSVSLTTAGATVALPRNFERYSDHYTLAAWVCMSSNPPPDASSQSSIAGRLAAQRKDGKLVFYFYFDSPSAADNQLVVLTSDRGLEKDQWHHVAVAYDHGARKLAFYIDRNLVNMVDLSSQVTHDDRPHLPYYSNIGGESGVVGVLNGAISDVFILDVACEKDDVNFLGGIMTPQTEQPITTPSDIRRRTTLSVEGSCAPAWWWIIPLVGQIALARVADCAGQPVTAPPSTSQIVNSIYEAFDLVSPAALPAGRQLNRSELRLQDSVRVHLDVGGEGPINSSGIRAGFIDAINLQAADGVIGGGTRQTQPPYEPIPNLVRMASWSQPYPFEDDFANYITMQNAPLLEHNVNEIARVINKNSGEIALWIDVETFRDNIKRLADQLNTRVIWSDTDEFRGKAGFPKTTIVLAYGNDEL